MGLSTKLLTKIDKLKPVEKAQLIDKIFESLDKSDPEIEKNWGQESERRYKAYQAGKIKSITLKEVRSRIEN